MRLFVFVFYVLTKGAETNQIFIFKAPISIFQSTLEISDSLSFSSFALFWTC